VLRAMSSRSIMFSKQSLADATDRLLLSGYVSGP
jgi:hypothetical protein